MRVFGMVRAISMVTALVMALALVAVSAAVPIPVDTDLDDAGWQDGVYVQPVMIAGEVRGDWMIIACHIHVQTEAAGAGEVMTATDGVSDYSDDVNGIYSYDATSRADPYIAGRATFTVPAGVTLTTTNTNPVVSGMCPAS